MRPDPALQDGRGVLAVVDLVEDVVVGLAEAIETHACGEREDHEDGDDRESPGGHAAVRAGTRGGGSLRAGSSASAMVAIIVRSRALAQRLRIAVAARRTQSADRTATMLIGMGRPRAGAFTRMCTLSEGAVHESVYLRVDDSYTEKRIRRALVQPVLVLH